MVHLLHMGSGLPCDLEITVSKTYGETGIVEYLTGKSYDKMLPTDKFFIFKDIAGLIFIATDWSGLRLSTKEIIDAINMVDCAKCIDFIKATSWYCDLHGALPGRDVTFYEECVYCGKRC